MKNFKELYFGGNGGKAKIESENIKTIAIYYGKYLHGIKLNGILYGKSKGILSRELDLNSGDFINEIEVHWGSYIDRIYIYTNDGKHIGGGGGGGKHFCRASGNFYAIKGKFGDCIDSLSFFGSVNESKTSDYNPDDPK